MAEVDFTCKISEKFGKIGSYNLTECYTMFKRSSRERFLLMLCSPIDVQSNGWYDRGTNLVAGVEGSAEQAEISKYDWERGQGQTNIDQTVTAEDEQIIEQSVARLSVILSHEV